LWFRRWPVRLKGLEIGDRRRCATCQQTAETANVSFRMNRETAARIRARTDARGERLSDALRRCAEEGDRAETHSGIVFRSGASGRRAALAGGPDVWEICFAARRLGGGGRVAERLAEELSLTPDRVAVALSYSAEFPQEIEARIELHERETAYFESMAGV
jgi:hypothetical protein